MTCWFALGTCLHEPVVLKWYGTLKCLNFFFNTVNPLFRRPKENGKKFEITELRNNLGNLKLVTMNHFLIKHSAV